MGSTQPVANPDLYPALRDEVARLAASPGLRAAFDRFRSDESQFALWQMEATKIAAPPFGEAERGAWLAARFRDIGLHDVHLDKVGNVFGIRPGYGSRFVSLSAHIDTVFPAETLLDIRQQGSRLYGPGVSDNSAGIAAILAVASILASARISHALPFLFIGNVGEEGEGDLRGMRHVFATPRWRDAIAYSVIVDGAGTDTIVAEALGSRRFEAIVRGPGGHSWSDFGAPSPVVALSRAVAAFSQIPLPDSPKTTFNVGVIRGGTSVNSIPESASMKVDLRSTSAAEIDRLESALRLAIEQAVAAENRFAAERGKPMPPVVQGLLHKLAESEVIEIGNRPAGELAADARLLKVIRAVDAHLGNTAQIERASTDANIPLSLGREAISIGGGGSGGGVHTLQEWFDCHGRDLGLRRILLTMLTLSGAGE
jgi:acetylornithine deacetylase/succinyl-diaminopimelate desuccinylase-like protein